MKVGYGTETYKSFMNNLGHTINGDDISLGQTAFGPEFSYRIERRDGPVIKPDLSIHALRLAGEYDGIGNSDFEAIGGQIWVNVPLK